MYAASRVEISNESHPQSGQPSAPPPKPPSVDYTSNSYNLRPALRAIMDAENWMLERTPEGQKLVIVFGESHICQIHPLLQQAVLQAHQLQKETHSNRSFAFGYEFEKEFWKKHEHIEKSFSGATELNEGFHEEDIYLNAFQKLGTTEYGKIMAAQNLLAYCQNENISVSFNDIACVENRESKKDIIDLSNPHAADILKRHEGLLPFGEIYPESTNGMTLRNIAIVENAIAHIERIGADIYIQQCGQDHVLGSIKNAYKDSLSARFLERGFEVLPVITDYKRYSVNVPADAGNAHMKQTVLIDNMAFGHSSRTCFEYIRYMVNKNSGLDL